MAVERLLTDGLIACIPFSVVVWSSFLIMPRIWLHSLPDDIQALAVPKTQQEKRWTAIIGVLVVLTFFAVPIALTLRFDLEQGNTFSIPAAFLHLYGVWLIVNLWDLIVIDWGYALFVNPDRPPIPGTAGARGYKDYRFHLYSSLKACVFSLIIIVPASIVIAIT